MVKSDKKQLTDLMNLVGAFIAVAIILVMCALILGGATTDCTTASDYNATSGATQTGWAAQCEQNMNVIGQLSKVTIIILTICITVSIIVAVKILQYDDED